MSDHRFALCVRTLFAVALSLAASSSSEAAGGLQQLVEFGAQDVYLPPSSSAAPSADSQAAPDPQLPQPCIDAGITTTTECDAFVAKSGEQQPTTPDQPAASEPALPVEDAPPAEQSIEVKGGNDSPTVFVQPAPSEQAPPVEASAPAEQLSSDGLPAPGSSIEDQPAAPAPEQAGPDSSSELASPIDPGVVVEAQPTLQGDAPLPAGQDTAAPSSESFASSDESSPGVDVLDQLLAAVDLYNHGVAELQAGNAKGQTEVNKAKAEIDAICATAGFIDVENCLAQFGLALNPLPPASAEQPTSSSDEPPLSDVPMSELPNANLEVTPNASEVLPPDMSNEAAPILDSAKAR